ncbi:hypothetical protein DY000_02017479 [Brassica cretica]|uniref:CCHC-type domain-containing protein n=1 Tax=Brassica cretica TaxID=69181 RepID=A0ABQ7CZ50_BRACR|nr:hypothetical protein DY000_02017479 [Brassica cretica]
MQRGRGGRAFRGGRFGGPRPRTPTCFTCGQLGHVRRDCPNVGQFKPAVPSRITCFTCGERGNHATSCPRTHLAQPVVSSAQPVRPVNPPLPLPPAKSQATAGRAYALELPGPSGPPQGPISGTLLVGGISAYILFDSGGTHSFVAPKVASRFDGEFTKLPGDRVLHDDAVSDCSYRTFDNDGDANSLVSVTLRRETLYSFGRKERPTSGSILLSLQRTF